MIFPLAFLFATPLAALLVALAAVSLPLAVHLLNRRRYRVVDWAAMRFLLAAQRRKAKRMRLEQLLLLGLRVLILLLLVLAMSSVMPWFEEVWSRFFPAFSVKAAAAPVRRHRILVLDGTLSMGAKPDAVSCFEKARSLATRLVEESPSGDGFSVVLLSAPPRRVVSEVSQNPKNVLSELKNLRLPHGNGDLAATLSVVDDMIRQAPDSYQRHEAYFFTDLQRSTWLPRPSAEVSSLMQKIEARAQIVFIDVGQDDLNNTAVTSLTVDAPFTTTAADVPILATLNNFGSIPLKSVGVQLLVGRARSERTSAPFVLNPVQQTKVDLKPGPNAVNFSYRFPSAGDYVLQVRAEADVLDLDDVRSAVVTVQETLPVVLVNGKPAAEPYDRATQWLKVALNPFPANGPIPSNVPARPRVLTLAQFADASLGDLSNCDCVFLCDVPRLSEFELRRLDLLLRRGGGVVFSLGPDVDLEAYNRLVFRTGHGILPARLLGRQSTAAKTCFNLHADDKAFHEFPLAAFAADRDRFSLLSARFRQYVRAEAVEPGRTRTILTFRPGANWSNVAGQNQLKATASKETARLGSMPIPGDPALMEMRRYRGRVLLFTSTLNMDWNTWPVSPSFAPFMQELLHDAVAGRRQEQAFSVGEVLEEYLQPGDAGLHAAFTLPDGHVESAETALYDDVGILRWTNTEQSGIFRATIGDYPRDYLFAVNVPAALDSQLGSESDLQRTNLAELQSAYPTASFQVVTGLEEIKHDGPRDSEPSPANPAQGAGKFIARWLLLTMLVLIVAEVVLAWQLARHGKEAPEATSKDFAMGRRIADLLCLVWAGLLLIILVVPTFLVLLHAAWTGDFLAFLPDGFRIGIETRLGVPPPSTGEELHWRIEFAPYLWNLMNHAWVEGIVAVAIAALVIGIYLHEGKTAKAIYRLLLAGLRISLLLLTMAVLLPQIQLLFERRGRPDLAILIDDSRSMGTTDIYQDEEIQQAAAHLGSDIGISTPERLQLAEALLLRPGHAWLERLLTDQRVKIHVYHCSTRAARLAQASGQSQLQAATDAVLGLRPDGESSQLGSTVRQVINDFRGSSLAAIIMLTDGVTTEGESLPQAAQYAARTGVPLFFVGVGSSGEVRELKMHDVQVEDSVYAGDNLVFEGQVTAQGYSDQRTIPVTLLEKGEGGRPKTLAQTSVTTSADGKPVRFRLAHKPLVPGEKIFVLGVPAQPDEIKPADSHRIERTVLVHEAKVIRLLYIEGTARYEFRFIKNLLERESSRDRRNKTIDLRVLLLDADSEYAAEDKSALGDFPTREELNNFDVVFLGDADPKDARLGETNLQLMAEFVKERGGGLLLIAGPRFNPHAYADTPLSEVMPIQPARTASDERQEYLNSFRPVLTGTGRFHPLFRFSPDEGENHSIWNNLAEVYWWSEGFRLQPAAEVLMVHPNRPADDRVAEESGGKGGLPLLVQQFVGAGRSMFLGIDETWRWRLREDEFRFNQFWIQMVRHLARRRTGRIELRLDRQTAYRRGEPIKLTVRFPDDAPPPAAAVSVEVLALRRPLGDAAGGNGASSATEKETVLLHKIEGGRATYEGTLARTPPGEYRFILNSPAVARFRPHAEARVLPPPGEMESLRMNQADMERAAKESHGRFYTLATADQLFDDLPTGTRLVISTPQPPFLLWNQPAVFAAAILLIGSEWALRRRKHLL
jgi:hypothetical protein